MNSVYLSRMRDLLEDEFQAYCSELEKPAIRGVRINTLKRANIPVPGICGCQSPFSENGYYLSEGCLVGSSEEYLCGHIYPQEPSASFAVTCMGIEPGMRVLDLCAAPGSKSTQIAELLKGEGLLVSNEINPQRAAVLKENIERHGAPNIIVLNTDPASAAEQFGGWFDAVLCDAPCSGEGMFRKDPQAAAEWSEENVRSCAVRQSHILDSASECVKPGGILLYSTCTFSPEENERNVVSFLKRHPEFSLVPVTAAAGRPGFSEADPAGMMRRVYPMDGGEGHFVAKMRKNSGEAVLKIPELKSRELPEEAASFLKDHLRNPFPYVYVYGEVVYGGTHPFISCGKLHLLRHQTVLGTIKNRRFEPSHALALSAYAGFFPAIDLSEAQFASYRRGETIAYAQEKGWAAVRIRGMNAGLVKSDGRILKNHYPKAFRIR